MSTHRRYRSRLVALADDEVLAAILADARRPDAAVDEIVRLYGRFHPDASPWAILAVGLHSERHPLRVEIHAEAHSGTTRADDLGHVRILDCADDPDLPGLPTVLAALDEPQVVRYRPGKRCTVRGRTADRERFVKLAPEAARHDAHGVMLWNAAQAGSLGFAVAHPLGFDQRLGAVHQGVVAGGDVVEQLLGAAGDVWARRLGRALGTLARADVQPLTDAAPAVQLDRTARAARRAADRLPALRGRLDVVVDSLASFHDRLRPQPLVPVHGAPHAGQWLDDGERLGLVDFDRFARGEPELDIATFLAEIDSESSCDLPVAVLEQAIVCGFETCGPRLDPHRLALYRRHKRLAKVTRTACSLRPDADERAARQLAAIA